MLTVPFNNNCIGIGIIGQYFILLYRVSVSVSVSVSLMFIYRYKYRYRWGPDVDTRFGIGIAEVQLRIIVSVSLRESGIAQPWLKSGIPSHLKKMLPSSIKTFPSSFKSNWSLWLQKGMTLDIYPDILNISVIMNIFIIIQISSRLWFR